MFLSCPNCQTEYDVPDAALTGRSRTLRCDNCMTQWKVPALEMVRAEAVAPPEVTSFASAETEVGASEDDTEIAVIEEPEPVAAEPATPGPKPSEPERVSMLKTSRLVQFQPPPPPSPTRGLRTSFVIAVLIIIVILVAHRPISHFWPPSLRLYNALGLR